MPKAQVKKVLAVGNAVFIRSVTNYYTGRIVALDKDTVTLKDAAWIMDTGRFSVALATGNLNEVEPYPGLVELNRSSLIDATIWAHPLPREMK